MPSLIKQTVENRNEKIKSVSISGPAYMVAVGGAARGSKAKASKYVINSRYLGSSIGSCHDLCKHGNGKKDRQETGLGSRKMLVMKDKGVAERIKMIEMKRDPKISAKKIGNFRPSLLENRKLNRNEIESKNIVKVKSVSSSNLNGCSGQLKGQIKIKEMVLKSTKVNHAGSLPRKSKLVPPSTDQKKTAKNKNEQLIAEKVTEMTEMSQMTMNETKKAELEFVPITVEIIAPSPIVTTESNNSHLPGSESSQSSSCKQVIKEDDPEEVILNGVDYAIVTSEGDNNYRVVICKDEETGGLKVQFRKGEVVDIQSEDGGPRKLKFRQGKVLEVNEDEESATRLTFKEKVDEVITDPEDESEKVTLKHQEVQERKEAQELLNRVIEETASKLVVDKKTKVRALVGAFESVISLQDGLLLTTS